MCGTIVNDLKFQTPQIRILHHASIRYQLSLVLGYRTHRLAEIWAFFCKKASSKYEDAMVPDIFL